MGAYTLKNHDKRQHNMYIKLALKGTRMLIVYNTLYWFVALLLMATWSSIAYANTFVTDEQDVFGPVVMNLHLAPNPATIFSSPTIQATVHDSVTTSSIVAAAYYSIDGGAAQPLGADDGAFDSSSESVVGALPTRTAPALHEVCVWGVDEHGNVGPSRCTLLAVYDPDGGFVVANASFESAAGAYTPYPEVSGAAVLKMNAKYTPGQSVLHGHVNFALPAADLEFRARDLSSLVVLAGRSYVMGVGTLNGVNGHAFLLSMDDGEQPGGGAEDVVRLIIWDEVYDNIIYDNQMGTAYNTMPTTVLTKGNIKLH